MRRTPLTLCAILTLAVAASSAGVIAQKKATSAGKADAAALPERIWRDPGDMASLDLIYGAGGKAHAPNPTGTFTFVKEDLLDTSPKFEVVDGQGVVWKVKLGQEPQSETAATRFLWAAGYLVDEDYYMATLTVKGLPTLQRGQEFVSADGIVHGARLERKPTTVKKLGNWDWFDNPFLGQRELNGLRVMMSLLNNWDLKMVNNSIHQTHPTRRREMAGAEVVDVDRRTDPRRLPRRRVWGKRRREPDQDRPAADCGAGGPVITGRPRQAGGPATEETQS